MKHARVKLNYLSGEIAEYILIENEDDLAAYEKELFSAVKTQIVKCMKSSIFPEHVDHMLGGRDIGTSLLAVAYYKSQARALTHDDVSIFNNPLYQLEPAAIQKMGILSRMLADGDTLLNETQRRELLFSHARRVISRAPSRWCVPVDFQVWAAYVRPAQPASTPRATSPP